MLCQYFNKKRRMNSEPEGEISFRHFRVLGTLYLRHSEPALHPLAGGERGGGERRFSSLHLPPPPTERRGLVLTFAQKKLERVENLGIGREELSRRAGIE
jgi:hypothetical protein